MTATVRLRSAVALLGRFPALAEVDLEVDAGEVVLVEGPNGAGKSTLLRVCAGLVAVSDGEAEVLGHDLRSDRRAVRRRVGLLAHASHLYDDLTVEDNVRFAVRAAGGGLGSLEPALERLGLAGRLRGVPAARLSAGQRRRVALAALVARAPELWLLDEPHAGLDADARDLLDDLVHDASGAGATVLMVSHEADRAAALAGRRVSMVGGQVVERGVVGQPSGRGLRTGGAAVGTPGAHGRAGAHDAGSSHDPESSHDAASSHDDAVGAPVAVTVGAGVGHVA